MLYGRTTLSKFIIEEQRRLEGGAELIALVNDIQTACKYIAGAVARGALGIGEVERSGDRRLLLRTEWGGAWLMLGLGLVNIVLAIWRPRFTRRRSSAT